MKNRNPLRSLLRNKKLSIPVLIVLLGLVVYALLDLVLYPTQSVRYALSPLLDQYQRFIEAISNGYLELFNTGVSITRDHRVVLDGFYFERIENGMLLKKWSVLTLLVFWFTPSNLKNKLIYSVLLVMMLLLLLPPGLALNALFNTFDINLMAPYRIGQTLPMLGFATIWISWIKRNRNSFYKLISKNKILVQIFDQKSTAIIIILYLFILLRTFISGYFAFEGWVNLIFTISSDILGWLGYNASSSPFYLYGDNVLIFMNKSCLGFTTMFVFAAIVYLTGQNKWAIWFYILIGLVVLNVVNVFRFVLLYIYLHHNGAYLFSIDVHDVFTAAIYLIVFLLWVLWFEFIADKREFIIKKK